MQPDTTMFLAAFGGGAAAGVVILGIELIRRYWERPLVKVTVGVGLSMGEDDESRDAQLVLDASNVHGQPVTLVNCGLILSTGHRVVLPRTQMSDFPIELGLQKPAIKTVSVERLLGRLEVWGCVPADVRYAYFTSSTGHVFKSKIGRDIVAALERGSGGQKVPSGPPKVPQARLERPGDADPDESRSLSWSTLKRLPRR
ncbi:MAG: hypothetical protein KAQ74_02340 [Dehalococcoidia bacterium]|nr:hypothetical protein [Dehalococcoidia bacterium]